jgi:hypothetical protein
MGKPVQRNRNSAASPTREHRATLREDAFRPVRLWLPDTRAAAFREKCERESRSLTGDPHDAEILARIAKAADTRGWK